MAQIFKFKYLGDEEARRKQQRVRRRFLTVCTYDLEKLLPYLDGKPLLIEWKRKVCWEDSCGWGGVSMHKYAPGGPYIHMKAKMAEHRDTGAALLGHEVGHQMGYVFLNNSAKRQKIIDLYCGHDTQHDWSGGPYLHRIMESFAWGFVEAYMPGFIEFPNMLHTTEPEHLDVIREMVS